MSYKENNLHAERLAFAKKLLILLGIFGGMSIIMEYFNGNTIMVAASLVITLTTPIILQLARQPRFTQLPLQMATLILVALFMVGVFTQIPTRIEKSVWIALYPFAFYFLTGIRLGTWLTAGSIILIFISYLVYPLFSATPRITMDQLVQIFSAYLLGTTFAFQYERIRTRQENELRQSAEHDPLTGLLNRLGFTDMAENQINQARRAQTSLAFVILDIDNFKQINDTQGHDAGDTLLKEIASLLCDNTRGSDLVSRWGGEEFLLLLWQTQEEGARTLCQKICNTIANTEFTCGKCTASFGIAMLQPESSMEETIRNADIAMYHAKQTGKNKVIVYTPSH